MEQLRCEKRCEKHEGFSYRVFHEDGSVLVDFLTKDQAERLVLCWNEHDKLLKACEQTIGFCIVFRKNSDWENHPEIGILYAINKQAITAAEKK